MKIAIVGTGYVGLSNGVLLAQYNEVVCLDIVPKKVAMLNRNESSIVDTEIEDYLKHKPLNLRATLDRREAYEGAEFVIIAHPPTMTRRPTTSTRSWSRLRCVTCWPSTRRR